MRNKTTATVLSLAAGAVVLTGAQLMAQGDAQPGTYQLAQIAGRPLPALIEEEGDCREEILSGTLTLGTDGAWVLVASEREVCGTTIDAEEERETGTYTVDGQTIRFLDDDDDDDGRDDDDAGEDDDANEIDVDDLAVGTLSASALTVRLDDGRTDLVFRR